ncbi:MAG: tetratricopeptide repeat protein [Acidobacteria bacterium]|nr:tetratricopeptide repeat protein [Acidobacteriota bacterium]
MLRFPWTLGFLFQLLMLIHFFRRRPEGYWFFLILFLGPLGALIYFVMEVVPDLRLKPPAIARFERKRRRQWLEHLAHEVPTLETLQELGEIYAADGQHARAVELFTRVLERDPDSREALYARGKSLVERGEIERAVADLEPVFRAEPAYHFYDAALTLAECCERLGRDEAARTTYQDVLGRTSISRAYYGYGRLLARLGETEKAREMMQQILAKKPTLPRYLRRQERPWFRKAETFLKTGSAP